MKDSWRQGSTQEQATIQDPDGDNIREPPETAALMWDLQRGVTRSGAAFRPDNEDDDQDDDQGNDQDQWMEQDPQEDDAMDQDSMED